MMRSQETIFRLTQNRHNIKMDTNMTTKTVVLQAEIVETQEGTHLLKIISGFGDPFIRVDSEKVKIYP